MSWIWLDETKYPDYQINYPTVNGISQEEKARFSFCVAEFKKEYVLPKEAHTLSLRISADSFFQLYVNDCLTGIGPAAAGGDFLLENRPAVKHYANNYSVKINTNTISIRALVRLLPQVLTDYCRGHGGFCADMVVKFADGTEETFATGEDWLARPLPAYDDFCCFDGRKKSDSFSPAVPVGDIWNTEDAPIPMLSLTPLSAKECCFEINAGEEKAVETALDKIYGVYPVFSAKGKCAITLETCELKGQSTKTETVIFDGTDRYMSFLQHSACHITLRVKNTDTKPVKIDVQFIAPWYPVFAEGSFKTSDPMLNKVYEVCKHTLKICRQTLHLDSTTHQELLACTGDYYIETLMNIFCFGDTRLSQFDLMRTADWLVANKGVMFHTTYSLIWVMMLRDTYLLSGNKELLTYCLPALEALLNRFDSYKGENGIIENPPDYMFVDWTVMDDYNMHHPPKYLGQAVLNAYYYGGLQAAISVFEFLDMKDKVSQLHTTAEAFKKAYFLAFFDEEKGLFCDGKGDETGESHWLPKNQNRKHFSKYPNLLAPLFGITEYEQGKSMTERVIFDDSLQDLQPYFMHWALCALRKFDLFKKYAFRILPRWGEIVAECDKGLKEGWIAPHKDYSFDHSHAWGGTPAYQFPKSVIGLTVLEPGMKKIALAPNLFDLEYAEISVPAPMGLLTVQLKKGEKPLVFPPDGMEVIWNKEQIL